MCKLSINNMFWLAWMSVVQNKHLPILKVGDMLLDTVNVCVVCARNYTTADFFPFFFLNASGFENDPIFGQFQSQ